MCVGGCACTRTPAGVHVCTCVCHCVIDPVYKVCICQWVRESEREREREQINTDKTVTVPLNIFRRFLYITALLAKPIHCFLEHQAEWRRFCSGLAWAVCYQSQEVVSSPGPIQLASVSCLIGRVSFLPAPLPPPPPHPYSSSPPPPPPSVTTSFTPPSLISFPNPVVPPL